MCGAVMDNLTSKKYARVERNTLNIGFKLACMNRDHDGFTIIPSYYISYDIIAFTYHSTTFKLFKTVQFVTFPSEYPSHVVALSLALAESFTIKRTPNILIVAVCIFIWQALWLTASSLFDVMQPMVFPCPIKTSHKIPIWTGCPLVSAIVK